MADAVERAAKFKGAASILAQDAMILAQKLRYFVDHGKRDRAEALAANLQRTARDVKWLMQRHP